MDSSEVAKSARISNKSAVFAALKQVRIKHVVLEFDGYADNGQIEAWDIEQEDGDDISHPDLLPKVLVERLTVSWDQTQSDRSQVLLASALEDLCYDLLDASYSGWGNNDGSYGIFVFDVEEGTVTLEHNRRCVETTMVEA
jgi:hypothetical protein